VNTNPILKRCFVLGAGFSKSFCPDIPLISDLTDLLFIEKMEESTKYLELCEYVRAIYRRSNKAKEFRNIENIATAILSKRIFKDDLDRINHMVIRYQLLRLIHDKINTCRVTSPNAEQILRSFVAYCTGSRRNGETNTIITFNYDLLIERTKGWIDYGSTVIGYPSYTKQDMLGYPVEYLKLHGSFNWFKAKGDDSTVFNSNAIYHVNEDDENYQIHKTDVPVFIPMAHSKESFLNGSLFNTLWAKANDRLKNSDEIIFIGYGFPFTDMNNFAFFLEYKEKITSVVVCEDPQSMNLSRLQTIFGKHKVSNVDAKEYIANNYQKA
jgi:hypothetical protein